MFPSYPQQKSPASETQGSPVQVSWVGVRELYPSGLWMSPVLILLFQHRAVPV
jgi:hypothetical protein